MIANINDPKILGRFIQSLVMIGIMKPTYDTFKISVSALIYLLAGIVEKDDSSPEPYIVKIQTPDTQEEYEFDLWKLTGRDVHGMFLFMDVRDIAADITKMILEKKL